MVVVVSYSWDAFHQQKLGNWSRLKAWWVNELWIVQGTLARLVAVEKFSTLHFDLLNCRKESRLPQVVRRRDWRRKGHCDSEMWSLKTHGVPCLAERWYHPFCRQQAWAVTRQHRPASEDPGHHADGCRRVQLWSWDGSYKIKGHHSR